MVKCKKVAPAQVLFGCFNWLFFACGCIEVVSGFLLLCDSRRILLSRLLSAPEGGLPHPPLYYLALTLLAAGLTVCAVSALGCWATYMPGYVILTIYFLLVLALLLVSCGGGVVALVWPRCVGLRSARGGAVGALQAYYGVPEHDQFTQAMDLAQTELECCGMTDARNFDMSLWQLRRLGPRGLAVPLSCCVQEGGARDHLNPRARNLTRCQEVAVAGAVAGYRHLQGCMQSVEDWYEQQYIVFLLGLFVVSLLKLGLLLSTVYSCIRHKDRRPDILPHSYVMRPMDNRNENVYDSKADEAITAKYVQPNNYYSPRVRNPRIFYNKPDEMI